MFHVEQFPREAESFAYTNTNCVVILNEVKDPSGEREDKPSI